MTKTMTLRECEEEAKERGLYASGVFEINCHAGKIGARWLDAYFGFIVLDGEEGFVRVKDIEPMIFSCENLRAP